MADSSEGKHSAGMVGLAALLGLAGAGRGACRGASVVAREASVLSHTAPMLAREGAIVGAGIHAASGAERAGMTFAREGSHLTAGARAAEGLEHPGSMLARGGAGARAHRGRGVVVVYGPTASETDASALRLTNGYVLRATAMTDVCRAAPGGCVLLLCSPATRCDEPDTWRAAADAWAATLTAASRSGEALTAARWEQEVPALDRGVSMVEGGDDAVRVAWLRRPLR